MDIEIPTDEFAISHGASRFKPANRVADLKRKKQQGKALSSHSCLKNSLLKSTSEICQSQVDLKY